MKINTKLFNRKDLAVLCRCESVPKSRAPMRFYIA